MAKFIAILLIACNAISSITASTGSSTSFINQTLSKTETQGGVLEFKSSITQRFENTFNNRDSIIISNYIGLPLKALQLKIIVGGSGKLKIKSVTRGSSIPASDFLFDYQIYKGVLKPDGSSTDEVRVVLLGNGNNVLYPAQSHHILTIEYDVVQLELDVDSTSIELSGVLGATCTPVQDANIIAGEEKTILLKKNSVIPESAIELQQNYPNPFNPTTKINFILKNDGVAVLKIFDCTGQEIATIFNEYKTAGNYEFDFNASNLSSGIYFYQVTSGASTDIKKMSLIK
jgi:hypothetical protein